MTLTTSVLLAFCAILASSTAIPGASPAQLAGRQTGGACTANGDPGVCETTTWCSDYHGTSVPGHCPGPSYIQCCLYPHCDNNAGYCDTTADGCFGSWKVDLCPGPSDYKCCVPE